MLNSVDLGDDSTSINALIPSIFGGISAILVIVGVSYRMHRKKGALQQARVIFAKYGSLSKPELIGNDEIEAILQRYLSRSQTLSLIFMHVASINPFLCLFFNWTHERVVFTQSDKVFILYSGILTSFLVS